MADRRMNIKLSCEEVVAVLDEMRQEDMMNRTEFVKHLIIQEKKRRRLAQEDRELLRIAAVG
jgi:hypothetical protein